MMPDAAAIDAAEVVTIVSQATRRFR